MTPRHSSIQVLCHGVCTCQTLRLSDPAVMEADTTRGRTFAWQLKPKTMIGMANSAPKSHLKSSTPSKTPSLRVMTICAQLSAMLQA